MIGELAGPAGPLRGFRLERRRSLTKGTYRLRGTADLGPGAAAATGFANAPDLKARLRDAGVDPGRVEELLAGRAAEGLHLRLVVDLPGRTPSFEVQPGSAQTGRRVLVGERSGPAGPAGRGGADRPDRARSGCGRRPCHKPDTATGRPGRLPGDEHPCATLGGAERP